MKQNKEKCKQISVCSSLASESGPRPIIRVKKHFEAAQGVSSSSRRDDIPTRPKVVNKLPSFITDVSGEQEKEECSQMQHQISKSETHDSKRKW